VPRTNIEESVWSDVRFDTLARLMGVSRFDAVARCAWLWRLCTEGNSPVLDADVVENTIPVGLLVRAKLARAQDDGVYICGTTGRIEWLEKMRANGRKGGRPKVVAQVVPENEIETLNCSDEHNTEQVCTIVPNLAVTPEVPPEVTPLPTPRDNPRDNPRGGKSDLANPRDNPRDNPRAPLRPPPLLLLEQTNTRSNKGKTLFALSGSEGATIRRIWDEQDRQRKKSVAEARPLKLTAARILAIRHVLSEYSEADCFHVLAVFAAEAAKTDGAWFNGVTNWRPESFATAHGKPAPVPPVDSVQDWG